MTASGIIPACAGSTRDPAQARRFYGDHPRMCGEHDTGEPTVVLVVGSSPHVRGAQWLESDAKRWMGIIPACAGSTSTRPAWSLGSRDHPRMCGEHPLLAQMNIPTAGSSPHVRGAQTHLRRVRLRLGIIPACAGSTSTTRARRCRPRDHPRMCGEHYAPQ